LNIWSIEHAPANLASDTSVFPKHDIVKLGTSWGVMIAPAAASVLLIAKKEICASAQEVANAEPQGHTQPLRLSCKVPY
jgi:hypothetical protein